MFTYLKFKFAIKLVVFITAFLVLTGCLPQTAPDSFSDLNNESLDCQVNQDCESGVCNFIKLDMGECKSAQCTTGDQSIGLEGQSTFYCDQNNQWQRIKQFGETCTNNYECIKITCKDNPSCHSGDFVYYCKDNQCVAEQQPDPCEQEGLVRIIQKDEYFDFEKCIETMAQREIQTVCAPCGNGKCDSELENKCNCPKDCQTATPLPADTFQTQLYSFEEMARHNQANDCWLLIAGRIYDVSGFVNSHPGGKALLEGCGREASQLFETRPMGSGTPHSENARNKLDQYYIGNLQSNF